MRWLIMKHHLLAIRVGCSVALLVVLSACGLPSAEPALPSSAPAPTTAPQPPESAPVTQPPAGLTNTTAAVQVVLDEYQAIAQKQYDQAYGLWAQNGAASGQTQSAFAQGYANTAGLSVLLDRATVSGDAVTVPITILSPPTAYRSKAPEIQKRFIIAATTGYPNSSISVKNFQVTARAAA